MKSVIIGNSVTSIGEYAFIICHGLTNVYINDLEAYCNIEFANEDANPVYYAKNLYLNGSLIEDLVIPEGVAKISDYLFYELNHIKTVTIPNSVTSIGEEAFDNCDGLTSVTIGNSVTSIGDWAFGSCSGLTSIEIPNSVTSIEKNAFSGCSGLTSVVWNAIKCKDFYSNPFSDSAAKITSFTFGDAVQHIPAYLCSKMSKLTTIEIPNSITSIGDEAFSGCFRLTSVTIGNSVTSIGNYAFYGCSGLKSIEIPNSVTSIGRGAFHGCSKLTIITLGNSLLTIGKDAFEYCNNIKKIESKATKAPINENEDQFSSEVYQKADLFVPLGYEDNYKYAYGWSEFNNIIGKDFTIRATSIALDKTEVTLKQSESVALTETILPYETSNKTVIWSTSDKSVATVDANGLVTAISVGEATITATTADGSNLSATCKVTVVPTLVISIEVTPTEVEAEEGSEVQLSVVVLPEEATNKEVTWSSSNESVATVDNNGLVSIHKEGEATITVTTTDGSNLSATCKVIVEPTLAESIVLDNSEITLKASETAELTVTVLPELTTDKSVVWSTSDESVATVDANGLVTAISVGEATITATTADGSNLSATCKVTVVPTLVISIEVTPTEVEAEEGSKVQLSVVVLPEEATNKEVAWSSSNESVATVDNNGLVSIHKEGEATITATTTDGSNLSATCVIKAFSGIVEVESLNFYVKVVGDDIVVGDAELGSQVAVYSIDGLLVGAKEVVDMQTSIAAPIKGIYLVRVGETMVKVLVK